MHSYWEVEMWDNLFNELLNFGGKHGNDATAAAELLASLEEAIESFVYNSAERVLQLSHLLRTENNMLVSR